ncbi:uncharacterized protein APUU_70828S [Aspergillus puulaauensis]|uniref:Uncharacterized protein n=1 Tax=Aspergillus puulaauensis TaxID=1220207 RepID=A0A7R8ATT8_9EURO|nr:uncharacterized protein APUU_70828S [Aspergillus puulaauensis]BCS29258.1 hypothetical protein APUU_70828S [Aspergillus puulaauensis]
MGFGFCIPDNPHDRVTVQLGEMHPDTHQKLHQEIPAHWRSKAWNPAESYFYIRSPSHCDPGHSTTYGVPNLGCLRGTPPALVKSVYTILCEHAEQAAEAPENGVDESWIWASWVEVLLRQMQHALVGITRWDGHLPAAPLTAGGRRPWRPEGAGEDTG